MVDYLDWDELGSGMRKEKRKKAFNKFKTKAKVFGRGAKRFGSKVGRGAVKFDAFMVRAGRFARKTNGRAKKSGGAFGGFDKMFRL